MGIFECEAIYNSYLASSLEFTKSTWSYYSRYSVALLAEKEMADLSVAVRSLGGTGGGWQPLERQGRRATIASPRGCHCQKTLDGENS